MPFILSKLTTVLVGLLLITNGASLHHEDHTKSLWSHEFNMVGYNAAHVSTTVLIAPNSDLRELVDAIMCDTQGTCALEDPAGQNVLPILASDKTEITPHKPTEPVNFWQFLHGYRKWEPLA